MPLTFQGLRIVSSSRCEKWHGDKPWSLSDWGVAMAGEAGETCNVIKKLNRIRDGIVGNIGEEEEFRAQLGEEIADTVIYLDLLANAAGINLESAIINKFNKVSIKNDFSERLYS